VLRVVTSDERDSPFEEIYRRYAPYVARVVLRLCGRNAEVEDLVQDVFLVAVRKLGNVREPAAVKGWLATIAVRVAGRRLRMRRMRRFLTLESSDREHDYHRELDHLVDRSASATDRVLLAAVYQLLDEMPSVDRVPWSLHYIEGETLESVAHLCGCSSATTKRRIARAQGRIEERLGD
jgi:RNA polymerase sigma-70 factor (ECF subfamily)